MFGILKKKFILLFLILIVQLLFTAIQSFALEKTSQPIIQEKLPAKTSKASQTYKKPHVSKWKKTTYKNNQKKYQVADKPKDISNSVVTPKQQKNEPKQQVETYSEQKPLNLSNYSDKKNGSDRLKNSKPMKGPSFFSILSSLFFVILLIIIFGWFYNKLRSVDPALLLSGKLSDNNANKFNILSTASLGQGKNIHLVEINGKHLIIGSTINNINLLAEINPEKNVKENQKEYINNENNDELTFDDSDSSAYNELYKEYLNDNPDKPGKKDKS